MNRSMPRNVPVGGLLRRAGSMVFWISRQVTGTATVRSIENAHSEIERARSRHQLKAALDLDKAKRQHPSGWSDE